MLTTALLLLSLAAEPEAPSTPPPDAPAPATSDSDASTIQLGMGSQKVLNFPGLARIALGDPTVADVKALGASQLLLIGLSEGRTNLFLWKANGARVEYRLHVLKRDPDGEGMAALRELLGADRGHLKMRMVGDRIFVEGEITDPDTFRRLREFPSIKVFAKLSPKVLDAKVAEVNQAFARQGLRNITATRVGDKVLLEGSVEDASEKQRAELVAKAILGDFGVLQ